MHDKEIRKWVKPSNISHPTSVKLIDSKWLLDTKQVFGKLLSRYEHIISGLSYISSSIPVRLHLARRMKLRVAHKWMLAAGAALEEVCSISSLTAFTNLCERLTNCNESTETSINMPSKALVEFVLLQHSYIYYNCLSVMLYTSFAYKCVTCQMYRRTVKRCDSHLETSLRSDSPRVATYEGSINYEQGAKCIATCVLLLKYVLMLIECCELIWSKLSPDTVHRCKVPLSGPSLQYLHKMACHYPKTLAKHTLVRRNYRHIVQCIRRARIGGESRIEQTRFDSLPNVLVTDILLPVHSDKEIKLMSDIVRGFRKPNANCAQITHPPGRENTHRSGKAAQYPKEQKLSHNQSTVLAKVEGSWSQKKSKCKRGQTSAKQEYHLKNKAHCISGM